MLRLTVGVSAITLFLVANALAQDNVLSEGEVLHGIRALDVWTTVAPANTVERYVDLPSLRESIQNRLRQFRINPAPNSDYRLRVNIILDKVNGGSYYVVRLEIQRPALVRVGRTAQQYQDTRLTVYDDTAFGSTGESGIGQVVVNAANNLVTEFLAKHALANGEYSGPALSVARQSLGNDIAGLRGLNGVRLVVASVENGYESRIAPRAAEVVAADRLRSASILRNDDGLGIMYVRIDGLQTSRGPLMLVSVEVARMCLLPYGRANRIAEGTIWRGFTYVEPGTRFFGPTVKDEIQNIIGDFVRDYRNDNPR